MQAEPAGGIIVDRPDSGGQIDVAVDQLAALNQELDNQIDLLWEKCRPVVLPEPPSPSATLGTIDPQPAASPVADRLRSRCAEAQGSIFRLKALRELLDL